MGVTQTRHANRRVSMPPIELLKFEHRPRQGRGSDHKVVSHHIAGFQNASRVGTTPSSVLGTEYVERDP